MQYLYVLALLLGIQNFACAMLIGQRMRKKAPDGHEYVFGILIPKAQSNNKNSTHQDTPAPYSMLGSIVEQQDMQNNLLNFEQKELEEQEEEANQDFGVDSSGLSNYIKSEPISIPMTKKNRYRKRAIRYDRFGSTS